MKILVGSRAALQRGIERREPKDLDYWVDSVLTIQKTKGEDYHVFPKEILDAVPSEWYGIGDHHLPTRDALYTIKCSHFQWNVHWDKTKLDILHFKSKGCKIIPKLYKLLVAHWKGEYGDKSFLSLKQGKEDFFTDNVTYVYDHDYIHELVAYPCEPMYTHVLEDGEDVMICKEKFDSLAFDRQVRMFREEIAAIAAERWLINPYWKGKVSWVQAHQFALKKTIISLTKNWASDFIIHNLEEFVKPDYSYFKHLIETLDL